MRKIGRVPVASGNNGPAPCRVPSGPTQSCRKDLRSLRHSSPRRFHKADGIDRDHLETQLQAFAMWRALPLLVPVSKGKWRFLQAPGSFAHLTREFFDRTAMQYPVDPLPAGKPLEIPLEVFRADKRL